MSLIKRMPQGLDARPPGVALFASLAFGLLLFLLTLRFGLPTAASGLDPSWEEVLAWAYLHHAQWGRELVFTYGPTGFLSPLAYHIEGTFWVFVSGQIVLAAALALITAALFYGNRLAYLCMFAFAFCTWFGWIPGNVAWPLTLIFGTTLLLRLRSSTAFLASLVALAAVFGLLACSKFSLVPLWLLCIACVMSTAALERQWLRAAIAPCMFVAAALLVWVASGQHLNNLGSFLANASEVAAGYGHAMGFAASLQAQVPGFICLLTFVAICVSIAWRARSIRAQIPLLLLYAATSLWAWRAFFTRGDHAPLFFALMSLLPFGLLCSKRLQMISPEKIGLVLLSVACLLPNLFLQSSPPWPYRVPQLFSQMRENLLRITHLSDLEIQRSAEWSRARKEAELPEISHRIGNASVDVFGVEQGVAVLNGFTYAPRPVFQSYSAYTPSLERLNEAHYLGEHAPEFVILKLEPIDHHLPTNEDALALIALLQRYEPILSENGFLLLQKSEPHTQSDSTKPEEWRSVRMGQEVPIPDSAPNATIAFAKVDLTTLGALYSLSLREPNLKLVLDTDSGSRTFRLLRPTAESGFMITPLLQSGSEWVSFYLGLSVTRIHSLRIEPEAPWQQPLFNPTLQVAFTSLKAHAIQTKTRPELFNVVLPGFSDAPTSIRGINSLMVEDNLPVLFLHAPGEIEFRPSPGRYAISSTFGIRRAASSDHNCSTAQADGIGISLILRRAADRTETSLLHRELDPFHLPADSGPHQLAIDNVPIASGDSVTYRVDPGHGGNNTACDWSYVRDLVLAKSGE